MALEEEQSSAAQELRRAIDCLMSSAELQDVAPGILEMLAAGAVHFSLPAGDLLFASGTIPDGVYLVASGRLGVRTGSDERMVAEVERGEWVGESGWLLKEPRSATVVALRDTELLLLPDAVLDAAAAQSPQFSLAIAQLCARRLTRSNRARAAAKRARVFALVPNSNEIDVAEFATQLTTEFGRSGRAELVWDVRATTHTSAWFSRMEELNDYVVYVADPTESGWTRQCCRQADVVLCLAQARGEVRTWAGSISAALTRGARIELALLHEGSFAAAAPCARPGDRLRRRRRLQLLGERRRGGRTAAVEALRARPQPQRRQRQAAHQHIPSIDARGHGQQRVEPGRAARTRRRHAEAAARERRLARLACIRSGHRVGLRLCLPRAREFAARAAPRALGHRRT
jgi:NTE family protein